MTENYKKWLNKKNENKEMQKIIIMKIQQKENKNNEIKRKINI